MTPKEKKLLERILLDSAKPIDFMLDGYLYVPVFEFFNNPSVKSILEQFQITCRSDSNLILIDGPESITRYRIDSSKPLKNPMSDKTLIKVIYHHMDMIYEVDL